MGGADAADARPAVRLPDAEVDREQVALPSGQAAALLAFLLTRPERAADRAELIEVLWPDRAPRDPQGALQPSLSRLRSALGAATLEGRERVRLRLPEPPWTEIDEAVAALASSRAAAKAGRWKHTRAHAEAALALLRPGVPPRHRRRLGPRPPT